LSVQHRFLRRGGPACGRQASRLWGALLEAGLSRSLRIAGGLTRCRCSGIVGIAILQRALELLHGGARRRIGIRIRGWRIRRSRGGWCLIIGRRPHPVRRGGRHRSIVIPHLRVVRRGIRLAGHIVGANCRGRKRAARSGGGLLGHSLFPPRIVVHLSGPGTVWNVHEDLGRNVQFVKLIPIQLGHGEWR